MQGLLGEQSKINDNTLGVQRVKFLGSCRVNKLFQVAQYVVWDHFRRA